MTFRVDRIIPCGGQYIDVEPGMQIPIALNGIDSQTYMIGSVVDIDEELLTSTGFQYKITPEDLTMTIGPSTVVGLVPTDITVTVESGTVEIGEERLSSVPVLNNNLPRIVFEIAPKPVNLRIRIIASELFFNHDKLWPTHASLSGHVARTIPDWTRDITGTTITFTSNHEVVLDRPIEIGWKYVP